MAELVKTLVGFKDMGASMTFTAMTGNDYFIPDNADQRVFLFVRNTNTQNATVTLKAGNGILSPLGDVSVTVGGGQIAAMPLCRAETARVKIMNGTGQGQVAVMSAVDTGGNIANVSACVLSVK